MKFCKEKAAKIAKDLCENEKELNLVRSFVEVCSFVDEFPDQMSWRSGKKPSVKTEEGLTVLADRYFSSYRRSDFPAAPSTVPDSMVSVIMEHAYGYTAEECSRIQIEHQHSMCAENCVGNLLERYIHSKLSESNWSWCCGEFVKAVDFICKDNGKWKLLQIKNRNNSENSSSSAIRANTEIQKWFRSFSKDTKKGRHSFTNWDNLPPLMQGYGLSEDEFKSFVISYLNNLE